MKPKILEKDITKAIRDTKIKEYHKKYREKNREKINENAKKYYQKNKERFKGRSKKDRAKNPAKVRAYYRNYYLKNKNKVNGINGNWAERNREQNFKWLLYYLGVNKLCCSRCGYDKSLIAIQFHHLDPTQKENKRDAFSIWVRVWGFKRFKKKIEETKFIFLCSNCHDELHGGIWEL